MKITQIVIEILHKCNFNCPYCRDNSGDTREISKKNIIEIINNFHKIGIEKIQLDGGEPFLYKDIFKLLDHIKSLNIEAGIYSNASTIDSSLASKLKKYVNLKLAVTLHPLNNPKELKSTFTGLKHLKNNGIYPNLILVISKKSIPLLTDIFKKIGHENYTLILNPLVISGRAYDNHLEKLDENDKKNFLDTLSNCISKFPEIRIIDNVLPSIEDVRIEKIQMNEADEFALHVNTDGDVLPFFSADKETSIGNVFQFEQLKNILNDKNTSEYLKKSKNAMKNRFNKEFISSSRRIQREEITNIEP